VALAPVEAVILFHLQAVVHPAMTILPVPEEPVMPAVGVSRGGRSGQLWTIMPICVLNVRAKTGIKIQVCMYVYHNLYCRAAS